MPQKVIVNRFQAAVIGSMGMADVLPDFLVQQVFVAFDTETTGMWAPFNRIVEIGAAKFTLAGGEPATFQSLVNPERRIPEEVIAVHGITDDMVSGAPGIRPVLEEFASFCGPDSVLVAHNAPFDISFVGDELNRVGLEFGDNSILDTVDIYHRLFPGLASYSLRNLIMHFGIARTQTHRALDDAIMVQRLLVQAAPKLAGFASWDDFMADFSVYHMGDWRSEIAILPEGFTDLQQAVTNGIKVEIEYQHPVKAAAMRVIHPRQVFKLGSVYYINAFCELAGGDRTFRLDRIASYRVLENQSF